MRSWWTGNVLLILQICSAEWATVLAADTVSYCAQPSEQVHVLAASRHCVLLWSAEGAIIIVLAADTVSYCAQLSEQLSLQLTLWATVLSQVSNCPCSWHCELLCSAEWAIVRAADTVCYCAQPSEQLCVQLTLRATVLSQVSNCPCSWHCVLLCSAV